LPCSGIVVSCVGIDVSCVGIDASLKVDAETRSFTAVSEKQLLMLEIRPSTYGIG